MGVNNLIRRAASRVVQLTIGSTGGGSQRYIHHHQQQQQQNLKRAFPSIETQRCFSSKPPYGDDVGVLSTKKIMEMMCESDKNNSYDPPMVGFYDNKEDCNHCPILLYHTLIDGEPHISFIRNVKFFPNGAPTTRAEEELQMREAFDKYLKGGVGVGGGETKPT